MVKNSLGQHLLKKYNWRNWRNWRNLRIYSLFLGSVQIYPVFSIVVSRLSYCAAASFMVVRNHE